MKKVILLSRLLFVILLCSCSPDSQEIVNPSAQSGIKAFKTTSVVVANELNPFDTTSEDYIRILSDYQSGDYDPSTLANLNSILNSLNLPGGPQQWNPVMETLLEGIIAVPATALDDMLEQSGLSPGARIVLTDFVDDFERLSEEPFEDIYTEIVSLEENVMDAATFSAEDKRVILTVMSIARYSKSKKCCEDTDWKTSVGNVVASVAGALENGGQASVLVS